MNKPVLGLGAFLALSVSQYAFAQGAHEDTVQFIGQIKAQQLVQALCELSGTVNGALAPNTEFNTLSSENDSGSRGSVTVKLGDVDAKLTITTDPTFTYISADSREDDWVLDLDNVTLKTGFASASVGDGDTAVRAVNLRRNESDQTHEVWFEARMNDTSQVFYPGKYKGLTTVTCEPGNVVEALGNVDEEQGDVGDSR